MDPQVTAQADALARLYLFTFALKVLGAVAIWIAGGWAIHLIRVAFNRTMRVRHVDATLTRYLDGRTSARTHSGASTSPRNSSVDLLDSIGRLRDEVRRVPNVLADPAPSVEILNYNAAGSVVTVRPYCNSEHYWQVYFDTNRLISRLYSRTTVVA